MSTRDVVDGFLLDRGFQIFNDAYPAARNALDLEALELRAMDSAVVVRRGGRLHRVGNPLADLRDVLPLVGTGLLGPRRCRPCCVRSSRGWCSRRR